VHVQEHKVGIFNELFHSSGELGDSCSVENTVVSRNAKVDGFCRDERILILNIFCIGVGLADSYYRNLRPQNCWHEVATSDVSNTGNAKSRICKV